ncbi:MAG: cupin domain-containing protein [Hyphomicrobiales bacterium]|nr:cupin domain-containing protein [Hyphomicrobiales bacterium]MCP4997363.1 cupin domain-containing protein [Hyphomicrobiales bacterium]
MTSNPKTVDVGNLFKALPDGQSDEEIFDQLVSLPGARIERIVSAGQTTPKGDWYDQTDDEWVVLLAGAARLQIDGETEERNLGIGDWLLLPAHCRHRVTWTQSSPATVWLAIHIQVAS